MSFKTEITISSRAAIEVLLLIVEHQTRDDGPFDNELLKEVALALGEADRIVITGEPCSPH